MQLLKSFNFAWLLKLVFILTGIKLSAEFLEGLLSLVDFARIPYKYSHVANLISARFGKSIFKIVNIPNYF